MIKRIKKRLLPVLLALLIIGGMLPGFDFTLTAYAEEASSGNWTDYAVAPALDPADTTGKTYIIDSPEKLAWVASQINSATPNTFSGYTLNITTDIDLSGHYWVPIGNSSANSFQGTVQGNNQEISRLTIGSAASPDTVYTYKGLFGYIRNATINNIVLKNVAVYSGTSASTYIGGLAGYADNNNVTISGCGATGYFYSNGAAAPVIGGILGYQTGNSFTAVNCWSQNIIYNNKLGNTGGLIGDARGTGSIKNCFATGKIFGNKSGGTPYVGGLLGNNANGMAVTNGFSNCIISTGLANAGGITGQDNYGIYSNVYAAGTINATGSSSGMFIGYTFLGEITNGYWNTSASPSTSKSVGGMLSSGSATGLTQVAMTADSFCTTLNTNAASIAGSVNWVRDSGTNGGFPYLSGIGDFSAPLAPTVINPVVSGTAEVGETLVFGYTFLDVKDHIESGSAIQWYRANNSDGSGAVPITGADNMLYELTSADASKYIYAVVTPSNGSVTGAPVQSAATARVDGGTVFPGLGSGTDGDPYQIYTVDDLKNIALASDSYYLLMNDITTGLDSVVCTGGTSVFNGHFDGGGHTVTLAVDAVTGQYTGMFGVVGSAGSILDLNISGSVSGSQIIGGIAASNQGTISNCTSNAVVLASGSISANVWAGGIAGENTGTITGCSVTGTIGADSLTGTVSLTAGFGGIAGHSSSATGLIADCHVNMTSFSVAAATFGTVYAGGIAGLNQYADAGIMNCYTETDLSFSLDSDDINSRVLVGGIAGHNDRGSITGCFATGNVTGGGECGIYTGGLAGQCSGSYDSPSTVVLSDSYYWGTVSGNGYVGGLIGYLYSATLSYCYSAGSVSGGSGYTGGLVGYNASGNTEYCYSNSYGTAAGGKNGGLYGGRSDIPGGGAAGSFWNRDNTSATYGDDANHLYPIGTSLSAIQMTGSNASANMPALDFTTPHFVIKDSTPTERYFPQLVLFANSTDAAVRAISLGSVTMAYAAPSVTTQPGSQSITAGETAEFTVAAAGGEPLSYQWKKDGVSLSDGGNISGTTAAELRITNAQKADEGSYTCFVSNASGGLDSNAASLTVNLIAPSITAPPSNQTVTEGGTAHFTVAAAGTAPLSYQWKRDSVSLTDGGRISGTTTVALTISNVQKADEGSYTCYISNAAGDVTSDPATLTVNLTSTKPTITWQPEDSTASAGWTVDFWIAAQGTAPLSYQWQKDGGNLTDGGKIGGATTNDLIIGNVQASDAGTYTCIVSNAAGSTASNIVTLTVDPIKPSIVIQPSDETRTVGDDVSFTVLAAGSEPFTYQWSKNGVILADGGAVSGAAAATLTISGIQTTDAGNYSCTISNGYGNVTSNDASLTVNLTHEAPSITLQPEDQTVPAGQAAVFTVEATGNTPLTYQWYKDGAALENAGCYTGVDTPRLHIGSIITDYAGTYTCLVTNDYGFASSNEAVLTVGTSSGLPPAITTTSLPNGAVGTPYSQTLAATGTTPISWYLIDELPPGLTLSLPTGIISGTPTTVGTFNFTARAENTNGDDTQDLSITINDDVLTINTPSLAAAVVGSLYNQTIAVTYTGSGTLTFSATGLPSGLAISSPTGEINGTPDAGSNTSSPYSVEVTVTDGTLTDTKTYSLTVDVVFVAVTGISGVPTTATAGVNLTLAGTVAPANATNKTIVWSVRNAGATGATISGNTLSSTAAGTVVVRATITNGLTESTNYTQDFNITVSATPVTTYTINASAGSGGSISPSGTVSVTSGGSQTFTISPNSGYRINAVTVDGIGQGAISTYSFMNVTANHTITVTFTYTGGGGGNGGGGAPSTPSTPEYKADVDVGNGSDTTLPVTVDKNSGSASVDIGTGNDFMSGGQTTVVTVPSVPDVDTYTLGVPVPNLTTPDEQGKIAFKTDNGSVTVPSNMLTGVEGISGSKAQVSIGQGNKDNLPDDVKSAIGNRPLVQLTLSIDGKQTDWSNPNAAVTVSIPYTPTADELKNHESIVIWYIDGSGNVVSVPNGRYDPATGTVTFFTTHFSNFAVGYNIVSFTDVADTAWYSDAVGFIAARGITSGTGNGNYSPEAKLTRGEFLVMIMRAYDIAPDGIPKDNFSDAGNTYYTGYLAAAKRLGISAGVGNNMFAPGKEITRQEMFTLLDNVLKVIGRLPQGNAGKTLSDFSDAGQVASWAKDAMKLLVETGTIGGNDGKLSPTSTATRAEMAQVLYQLNIK